jgi:hypothetical protein
MGKGKHGSSVEDGFPYVDVALGDANRRNHVVRFRHDLMDIEDSEERAEEAKALWDDLRPLARACAEWRVNS